MAFPKSVNFGLEYLLPDLLHKLRFFGYNLDRFSNLLLKVSRLHLLLFHSDRLMAGRRILALSLENPDWGPAYSRFLFLRVILNLL